MADNRSSIAGRLALASDPKTLNEQSQRSLPTHRWVDNALLLLLAGVTIGFWVGVACLIGLAWKN
jgi:hypothetical protein